MPDSPIHIVKIGGNILDNAEALDAFLNTFAPAPVPRILVHGGGKYATTLAAQLNIPTRMHHGRRITDAATLDVAVMVYAGLLNKKVVARLQSLHCNSIGLCGADAGLIPARRRQPGEVDFGFVGDPVPDSIQVPFLLTLLKQGITPVIAPITHDGNGQVLNTNADTMASALALALAQHTEVRLAYCFEKNGVLRDTKDPDSVIPELSTAYYAELKQQGMIADGMLPKLDNAFAALQQGVQQVWIGHASHWSHTLQPTLHGGTQLIN